MNEKKFYKLLLRKLFLLVKPNGKLLFDIINFIIAIKMIILLLKKKCYIPFFHSVSFYYFRFSIWPSKCHVIRLLIIFKKL